jgi:photosystem II stability/assembly factor-like uncharacterized protein
MREIIAQRRQIRPLIPPDVRFVITGIRLAAAGGLCETERLSNHPSLRGFGRSLSTSGRHTMAKRTRSRKAQTRRARAQLKPPAGSVEQRDFDAIKPRKILPGVIGRSLWFAERAGIHEDALSLERLLRATTTAERMHTLRSLRLEVSEEAREIVSRIPGTGAGTMYRQARLLQAKGGQTLRPMAGREQPGITALSGRVRVGGTGILMLPVDEKTAAFLDLEDVVVADVSDPAEPRLNPTFTYWPQERVLVGRVTGPGEYEAHALPKDPAIRLAFDTLASHWKWVEREFEIRKSAPSGDAAPGIVDRICELILCAPDFQRVTDPRHFEGIGLPAGDVGGGNVCERCLRRFLGELDIVDGIPIRPPIIAWALVLRPRCSRWISIGPVPDATFRGIGRVTQLAIHPTNGNMLIAGAAGGGVWRTDNGGASWRPQMELQPTLTIGAVAIAPSNPQIIYAASGEDGGGWNPAWSGVGIYRSQDGGAHWTLMTSVASTRFSAIVVHPKKPDVIYVAGNRGLHKSVDGGLTWRTNPGLSSLFDGHVTDVVIGFEEPVIAAEALRAALLPRGIDNLTAELLLPFPVFPFNTERVYIGVREDGVYRSTTAGEQIGFGSAFERLDGPNQLPKGNSVGWTKLAIGRRGAHRSFFLAAKLGPDGSRIFTTIDGGTTWTELANDVANVGYDEWCSVIAVDSTNENVLYAGAAGALKRTTTGGATAASWTSINTGIHADQQDIVFDPNSARRIFLANDGGVYRSNNQGTSWTMASGSLAITQFYDIDISEKDRDIAGGGAQDNGVYYRNAAGVWTHIPWGDGTQLAIDPTDPQIFYFSSQNGLPENLRRSVNGGASHQQVGQTGLSGGSPWVTIIKLEPRDPIANPAANRVLFVCGHSQLFRSTNGGQTWQRVEDGSGNPFQSAGEISALEFAISNPSILYLATTSGAVYRAINGGATAGDWTRIDTPGSPADALFPAARVQAIRVNPFNPNHVWLVFGGSGVSFTGRPDMILNPLGISHVFRNVNATNINGWQDASGQFPALSLPDVPTSAVALADFDPAVAYAGTDVGVFRTTDGGVTWMAFQDGLPRSPVVELRFNRRFNRLFAGTMGRGIYVRDV